MWNSAPARLLDEADADDHVAGGPREAEEIGRVPAHPEGKEVGRGEIAGEREFREEQDVDPALARLLDHREVLAEIRGDIAGNRGDLRRGDGQG